MIEVNNTGERILLEKETSLMIARHFCAYKFAKEYAYNKRFLDIGCGEGYGTSYVAQFAREVIGVDYDKAIIEYARNKYRKDNLMFREININQIGSLKDKFDTICVFQVIEHIKDTKLFLENIKNLLNDNGVFLCSTPNRLDASPHSESPFNKFHVKEYLLNEFRGLLEEHFKRVDISGLKRNGKLNFYRRLKKIGLFNFLPQAIDPVKRFYAHIDYSNFVFTRKNIEEGLDFIAVCKK